MEASSYVFYTGVHPKRIISQETPLKYGYEYEQLSFQSLDNLKLDAWLVPGKNNNKVIIVLHGYPFDKGDILNQTLFLTKEYDLFFFDFRAHGKSEGRFTTFGKEEVNDILGAIKYLKSRDYVDIGAIGFSLGASSALIAAEQTNDIKAIVSDAAYANLDLVFKEEKFQNIIFKDFFLSLTRLIAKVMINLDPRDVSPMDSVKNYDIPILIIHADVDTYNDVNNAYLINNNAKNAELWIIENNDEKHGLVYNIVKDEYEEKVLEFFKKHV